MYEILDAINSYNLRTKTYDTESRLKGAAGNCSRTLWRRDKIGLFLITQDAGVGTATKYDPVGFVYHPNCIEIEYLLDSVCDLKYPDGTHVRMETGDVLVHQPYQPHGMQSLIPKNMQILAIYSCAPADAIRLDYDDRTQTHPCDKWAVSNVASVPSTPFDAPGVDVRILLQNNEQPLTFAEVILEPMASIPLNHFTQVDCDEMVWVRKGGGLAIYPDQVYPLQPNFTMYNDPGQPYKYINTGDEPMHLLFTWSVFRYSDIQRSSAVLK